MGFLTLPIVLIVLAAVATATWLGVRGARQEPSPQAYPTDSAESRDKHLADLRARHAPRGAEAARRADGACPAGAVASGTTGGTWAQVPRSSGQVVAKPGCSARSVTRSVGTQRTASVSRPAGSAGSRSGASASTVS